MTLIIYASRHGSVRYCAQKLSQLLKDECRVADCSKERIPDITAYDRVIIGFSIHAGSIQKSIKRWIDQHLDRLISMKPGLFCCCLSKEEQAIEYFHKDLPKPVIQSAGAIGMFGAIVDFAKMGLFERFIMKRITKRQGSYSTIDQDAIAHFVTQFEKGPQPHRG
jgi:menaquinone-dependent protoporphyrinogen oxidase